MRVIVVTTFFPNTADRQRAVFVQNLVRAMKSRCDVEVVSPVPLIPPFPRKPEWQAQRAIPARDRVDGIEVQYPRYLVIPKLGWLSGLGYFLGILQVLRRYGQDGKSFVIHAHCAYPDAVGVALAAKLLRLPFVVTAHGSDINVYADRSLLKPQIRWALRRAAGVIAVSGMLESKIADLIGKGKSRVAKIPCAAFNGDMFYPRDRHETRSALGLDMHARVAVFVGQLVPIKGVGHLVDAWATLRSRGALGEVDRLILVGEGPDRHWLEKRINEAGLSAYVRFTGAMAQVEVASWIAAANLLCLPSLNEGTPNVIVEALASGVPVVASRVGGIPDLIRDGENGMLVPPADSDALADALQTVLERGWQAASVAASVAHLTWQAIADRNCDFIQTLFNDHGTHV